MPQGLSDILNELQDRSKSDDELSVQDVLDAFEDRTFGPFILSLGLIAITPIGMIPLVPTTIALLLLGVVGQALLGRRHPWIPRRIRKQAISQQKLAKGIKKARPWARRIDKIIKPRLTFLTEGPLRYFLAVLALPLALTMPPLELVPFAVFIPATGIVLLGLSVTAKDGVLALAAALFALAAPGFTVWWFFFK